MDLIAVIECGTGTTLLTTQVLYLSALYDMEMSAQILGMASRIDMQMNVSTTCTIHGGLEALPVLRCYRELLHAMHGYFGEPWIILITSHLGTHRSKI